MSATPTPDQSDEPIQRVRDALGAEMFFDAERIAVTSMQDAHTLGDYAQMAQLSEVLREARRGKLEAAVSAAADHVEIIETVLDEEPEVQPGISLVQPPLVGADARRLRLIALSEEIPALIMCREPTTQLGLCPVVLVGRGCTVRVKVTPPSNPDKPDTQWLLSALEALGEVAAEMVNPDAAPTRRVEHLLTLVETVPEAMELYDVLAAACLDAHAEQQPDEGAMTSRGGPDDSTGR